MYPNDNDYIKEELTKIQNLFECGYILENEYEKRKKEILGETEVATPINNFSTPTANTISSYDYGYNYDTTNSYDYNSSYYSTTATTTNSIYDYNSSYYSTPETATVNTISYSLSNYDIVYSDTEIPILNGPDSFDYSKSIISTPTPTTYTYSNPQINYTKTIELPTPTIPISTPAPTIPIPIPTLTPTIPISTPTVESKSISNFVPLPKTLPIKLEDTLIKSNDLSIMDIEGFEGHPLFKMKGPFESVTTKKIYVDLKGFKRERYIGTHLKRVDNDNWKSGKVKQQCLLKNKIIFDNIYSLNGSEQNHNLKLIGGCGISFTNDNKIDAVASIVILEYSSCKVVFESYKMIKMTEPLIEGYKQFREVPHFLDLWNVIVKKYPQFKPSLMVLNGCGINQQRSVGAATQFGILADIPTIGVSTEISLTKGITQNFIDTSLKTSNTVSMIDRNDGNRLIGHAFRNNDGKILYVSPGHKMDAQTSLQIANKTLSIQVGTLTVHSSIPEPIYQANHLSHLFMKNYYSTLTKA